MLFTITLFLSSVVRLARLSLCRSLSLCLYCSVVRLARLSLCRVYYVCADWYITLFCRFLSLGGCGEDGKLVDFIQCLYLRNSQYFFCVCNLFLYIYLPSLFAQYGWLYSESSYGRKDRVVKH